MVPAWFMQGHSGAHVNSGAANEVICYQQTGQGSTYQLLEHRATKNNFLLQVPISRRRKCPCLTPSTPNKLGMTYYSSCIPWYPSGLAGWLAQEICFHLQRVTIIQE